MNRCDMSWRDFQTKPQRTRAHWYGIRLDWRTAAMAAAAAGFLIWAALNMSGCAEPRPVPAPVEEEWSRNVSAAEFVGISTQDSIAGYDYGMGWKTVSSTDKHYTITVEFLCPGEAYPPLKDNNARWICRDAAAAFPQDRFNWDAVRCNYGGIAQYEMVAPLKETK